MNSWNLTPESISNSKLEDAFDQLNDHNMPLFLIVSMYLSETYPNLYKLCQKLYLDDVDLFISSIHIKQLACDISNALQINLFLTKKIISNVVKSQSSSVYGILLRFTELISD